MTGRLSLRTRIRIAWQCLRIQLCAIQELPASQGAPECDTAPSWQDYDIYGPRSGAGEPATHETS